MITELKYGKNYSDKGAYFFFATIGLLIGFVTGIFLHYCGG